jgi:hypothetical protein
MLMNLGGTGAAAVATRGGPITVQADVYSFGVIVHECLTRRSPHHGEGDPAAVLEGVRRGERALAAPPGCGVAAAALLSDCLQHDPARRPPFAELDRRLAALEAAQLASSALEGPAALHAHRGRAMPAGWAAALSAQVGDSQMQRILDSSGLLTQGAAEALLRGEKVPPERKEMVTMHFSDVVGFTAISAGMPAEKVRAGRETGLGGAARIDSSHVRRKGWRGRKQREGVREGAMRLGRRGEMFMRCGVAGRICGAGERHAGAAVRPARCARREHGCHQGRPSPTVLGSLPLAGDYQ